MRAWDAGGHCEHEPHEPDDHRDVQATMNTMSPDDPDDGRSLRAVMAQVADAHRVPGESVPMESPQESQWSRRRKRANTTISAGVPAAASALFSMSSTGDLLNTEFGKTGFDDAETQCRSRYRLAVPASGSTSL